MNTATGSLISDPAHRPRGRHLREGERMSRKDVSLVSTFIGAVPWVTIRIQTKSGLEKRSLERSITIQATYVWEN